MQLSGITDALSLTGRRWAGPTEPGPAPAPGGLAIPHWIRDLLLRRGISGDPAIGRYLEPSLASLEDPLHMADMAVAVQRLATAISLGERITVYGDYDVDGVCSTTVLVEFLRRVGAQVDYYIPDRRAEGYGLNETAVRELARRSQIMITTDCGITAVREIALARELGLDVVVVDHHQVGPTLPPSVANLNPHRPDCAFPFKGLCAAGVAFMLVMALRRHLREQGAFRTSPEPDVRELLDLVAVATIADMVPMQHTNRTLVAAGLRVMARGGRVGLRALCEVAKIDLSRLSATDVAFRIGPRINARGRMSHAVHGVDLLLTRDPTVAKQLAAALDAANELRRQVEKDTVEAAMLQIEREARGNDAALVAYDPSWHPGVLGLVATRLVGRWHRPAVVIGEGGKGSGRSIEGLDLHAALTACAGHLERFGGHPAAAGVTIDGTKVDAFRVALAAEVQGRLGAPPFVPVLRPDLELPSADLSLDMVLALQRLAPFGQGNPEPLFLARQVAVTSKRLVGLTHLKLRLGPQGHDAIAFGLGSFHDTLPAVVDLLFHLESNTYQGRTTLQLRIQDLRPAG